MDGCRIDPAISDPRDNFPSTGNSGKYNDFVETFLTLIREILDSIYLYIYISKRTRVVHVASEEGKLVYM